MILNFIVFMFKVKLAIFAFGLILGALLLLASCQEPQLVSACVIACHETVIAQNDGTIPSTPTAP